MKIRSNHIKYLLISSLLVVPFVKIAPVLAGFISGFKCQEHTGNIQVCVQISDKKVYGFIRETPYNVPTVTFARIFKSATVFVEQCNSPNRCGTISANKGSDTKSVQTSQKPVSYGHIYRTGASYETQGRSRAIRVYSPYIAAND